MHSIQLCKAANEDGVVHLEIPLGIPSAEYDIVVVAHRKTEANATPEDRGWPPGYFERTFGSIADKTFMRHPVS